MTSKNKFVFVVEDSSDMRNLISELLQQEGYRVDSAINGEDALRKLKAMHEKPDTILLDLMMPIKDGFEFRVDQELDATIATIPVIVMTADANVDIKTIKIGAVKGLKKPVEIDQLLEALDKVVGG